MAHIVTAALVITKKQDGSDLYLYENAELPDWVSADEIQRLTEKGLIDKVSDKQAADKPAPAAQSN